jgi:hypothetical protein
MCPTNRPRLRCYRRSENTEGHAPHNPGSGRMTYAAVVRHWRSTLRLSLVSSAAVLGIWALVTRGGFWWLSKRTFDWTYDRRGDQDIEEFLSEGWPRWASISRVQIQLRWHLLRRLRAEGDKVNAVFVAGECLEILRSHHLSHRVLDLSLTKIAEVYEWCDDWEAALPLREEDWLIEKGHHGEDDPRTITAMEYVATAARRLNDFDRAIQLQRLALDHWRTVEGATSARACRTEAQLGITLHTGNRSEEARPLLEHPLDYLPAHEGVTHMAYSRLASALKELGEVERAVRVAAEGVRLVISTYGSDDPRTFQQRQNLAVFQWNVGDFDAAHLLLAEVLADNEKLPESQRRDLSQARGWLARLEVERGE